MALIVTLLLDPPSQAQFEALRQAHFPPERNLVPAHVSLFHALPDEHQSAIETDLREAEPGSFPLLVTGLRSLGRGVAYRLESAELKRLRGLLAERWWDWLTPQDRGAYAPHVTVQNKASPEAARLTLARLSAEFQPWTARAEALLLWRYLGGPWERLGMFAFRA